MTAVDVHYPPKAPTSATDDIEFFTHKGKLIQYTQNSHISSPVYETVNEGFLHAPKFRSTVHVDGEQYTSPNTFFHKKHAEQEVSRFALECISSKIIHEGCPPLIKDMMLCKCILNELAAKNGLDKPLYNTTYVEALIPLFISSAVFNGATHAGTFRRSKKDAEQEAAFSVISYLLANSELKLSLYEIIRSKRLFTPLMMNEDRGHALVVGLDSKTDALHGPRENTGQPIVALASEVDPTNSNSNLIPATCLLHGSETRDPQPSSKKRRRVKYKENKKMRLLNQLSATVARSLASQAGCSDLGALSNAFPSVAQCSQV